LAVLRGFYLRGDVMQAMDFTGRWVLVTGASSGLGREMARTLAYQHHANVILVARRGARLRELSLELKAKAGVQARVIEADLSCEGSADRVYAEAITYGEVYGVILNAGVTYFGEHRELSWSAFQTMLSTNVTSTVRLTSLFAPYLVERGNHGGILLITSMAGLIPVPYQSAYSGTKAFLVHFGRGLWHELRDLPVSITTFVPGGIATELMETSRLSTYFRSRTMIMSAEACARLALGAFAERRYMYVPGFLNRLGAILSSLVPRIFSLAMGAQFKKALLAARKSDRAPNAA
jgi:short-subunit dehydrogenase